LTALCTSAFSIIRVGENGYRFEGYTMHDHRIETQRQALENYLLKRPS
jgi:hypothetical protein